MWTETVETTSKRRAGLFGRGLSRLRSFRKEESGVATVEFVIWFPFYLMMLGLIGDATITFMNYNRMWDAARDTARRATVGEMDVATAEQHASDYLPSFISPNVTVDNTDPVDIVVSIEAPLANLSFFGTFNLFTQGYVSVNVVMRKET